MTNIFYRTDIKYPTKKVRYYFNQISECDFTETVAKSFAQPKLEELLRPVIQVESIAFFQVAEYSARATYY